MHDCKRYSLTVAFFCAILIVPALWFPSWDMYLVVAGILCLVGLVGSFLMIMVLFVLVWALTRFMVKGEN